MALPLALLPWFTPPYMKLDDDGNLVINEAGLIYTYASNGVDLQNTYQDQNGNSAHSNPIVINAAGWIPSNAIYVLPTGYVIKYRDSDGNLIRTFSFIEDVGSAFLSELGVQQSTGTVTSSSPYTQQSTDNAIYIEFATSGTVQLLSAAAYLGALLIVNRAASTQSVTPHSGQTINAGAADASFTMAAGTWPNYPALLLLSDGVSNWTIQSYSNVP